MPRHASPGNEPRIIAATIWAKRPTCHLCSWAWAWDEVRKVYEFAIKRPNANCDVADEERGHHRGLIAEAYEPLAAWLQAS